MSPIFVLVHRAEDVKRLTKYLDISDASITASSERGVNHAAKLVRIDRYYEHYCGWTAAAGDHAPWVQLDMQQEVTAWGVFVKFRCDEEYINDVGLLAILKVATTVDRLRWDFVSRQQISNDPIYKPLYSWFEEAVTAQYWRLHLLGWGDQPTIKADLVGQLNGKQYFDTFTAASFVL